MTTAPHSGLWISREGLVFFANHPVARLISDAPPACVQDFRDFAAALDGATQYDLAQEDAELRDEIARLERQISDLSDLSEDD